MWITTENYRYMMNSGYFIYHTWVNECCKMMQRQAHYYLFNNVCSIVDICKCAMVRICVTIELSLVCALWPCAATKILSLSGATYTITTTLVCVSFFMNNSLNHHYNTYLVTPLVPYLQLLAHYHCCFFHPHAIQHNNNDNITSIAPIIPSLP